MRRRFGVLIICLMSIMLLASDCNGSNSDRQMENATERAMQEANRQIGMPAITNFQERKLAKMIFELRDQADLVCYAYIVSMHGKLVFIGKSIGYGLPYSIQYTNPEKYLHNGTTLPQADPNGLFMPTGLSATWLMLIDPKTGKPKPVYFEPEIVVSPFQLHQGK